MTGRRFCYLCKSHFCPHVAPHLYRPPYTRSRLDDTKEARAEWEEMADKKHDRELTKRPPVPSAGRRS